MSGPPGFQPPGDERSPLTEEDLLAEDSPLSPDGEPAGPERTGQGADVTAEPGTADPEGEPHADEAGEGLPPIDEVGAISAQRDEYLRSLQLVQAEFANYRKRVLKQQTEHLERAAEDLVTKLFPVLDALDLAMTHSGGRPKESEARPNGDAEALAQVAGMLGDLLAKEGLERLDPGGEPFDPTAQDAVLHEEGDGGPTVAEVLRPGYRWKGRVLRPAMVKVRG